MEPPASNLFTSVSNLVPVWDEPVEGAADELEHDGGGTYHPAEAVTIVEQVVHHEVELPTRLVTPPEHFDVRDAAPARSTFSYDVLAADPDLHDPLEPAYAPDVDYDDLRRRDIARELLRARLIAIAERRERRSAYEIAFILLAAAVAVLLAAPPLVQVLLAAHGTQA